MFRWFFDWLRRLFAPAPRALPAPPRTPTLTSLQLGDIVEYLGETYLVGQRIVNHANGFFWYDYRLDGDERYVWLSVEDDDELIVAFYRPVELELAADPPEVIEVAGTRYTLSERGESDAKITRDSGTETRARARRWDYSGADGTLLGIQSWGEADYEVMRGERVRPAVLELLPGGD